MSPLFAGPSVESQTRRLEARGTGREVCGGTLPVGEFGDQHKRGAKLDQEYVAYGAVDSGFVRGGRGGRVDHRSGLLSLAGKVGCQVSSGSQSDLVAGIPAFRRTRGEMKMAGATIRDATIQNLSERDTLSGALDVTAIINARIVELLAKATDLAVRLCGPTPATADNEKGIPATSVPIIDALHGNQRAALRLLDELGVELNRITSVIG